MDIILEYLNSNPLSSSKVIFDAVSNKDNLVSYDKSYKTLTRYLTTLVSKRLVSFDGEGKGRKYSISKEYQIIYPIDIEQYFEKSFIDRDIKGGFNFDLINTLLKGAKLFTDDELEELDKLQESYNKNISKLTDVEYKKALEHLSIDLAWKSSEIEGNAYTLLETEFLIIEQRTAGGKSLKDANMLLNHKEAIDFLITNPAYLKQLTVANIEDIHSILIANLGVKRNIREGIVNVKGTKYKPLDNMHQIKEAVQDMCDLINSLENVFEKALLALVLISYIQAFGDGNKRTARIVSNGILMQNKFCPISFITIDSVEYKKAMLIFYEQNNLAAFKNIFIEQFKYSAITYFS